MQPGGPQSACCYQAAVLQLVQIPCKGRGEAPSPEVVNEFVGDVMQFIMRQPGGMIMIHCTHGFNRTGGWWLAALPRHVAE